MGSQGVGYNLANEQQEDKVQGQSKGTVRNGECIRDSFLNEDLVGFSLFFLMQNLQIWLLPLVCLGPLSSHHVSDPILILNQHNQPQST